MKRVVSTDKAPAAIGPYSQAIVVGDLIFTSGQIPIDPATGELVEGGIEAQATQSMENVKNILAAEGLTFDNVVKTTIFLKDMNDFAKVNEIYGKYFSSEPPARSCFQIGKLPKDAMIEIEVIAHLK